MKIPGKIRFIVLISSIILLQNCTKAAEGSNAAPPAPELPVYTVITSPATTYQEFPTALEGKNNVEIRSQVDGYLDKIYVEEGAYVRAGQPLFKIDSRAYGEQMNMASANFRLPMPISRKLKWKLTDFSLWLLQK
jgi:membrane fusion protein (multidrug efflux system)